MQFPARQHRLQQIPRVHRPLGLARAHHRVQFVDEQNDLARRLLHFLQHRLEPLFELAAKLRAGNQRAHVERDHPLVLQPLRHVAAHDAQRQSLHDRRLSHARLADQHRIVLGPPREHLDHPADLLVAPDHRIELARRCQLRQVAPVPLQRLVSHFRILRRHPLVAAHLAQRLHQALARDAEILEVHRGQQHVLHGDVLVLELRRLVLGRREQLVQPRRDVDLVQPAGGPRDFRQPLQFAGQPLRSTPPR